MDMTAITRNSIKGGYYKVYEAPEGVRRSYAPTTRSFVTPTGTCRPMRYGDRVFVRLESMQGMRRTLAEFTLTEVNDLTEVIGELRHYTRGLRGLTRLYVRNVTRGWSFEQPFMLYSEARRVPGVSVTHPARPHIGAAVARFQKAYVCSMASTDFGISLTSLRTRRQ